MSKFIIRPLFFILTIYLSSFITISLAQAQSENASTSSRYQQAKDLANKHSVSVIGGGISGTYIRFATDMANVLNNKNQSGLRIIPIVGLGGGQNVKDIMFLKGIDMGIVQSEHLAYLQKQDPVLYRNINNHVRFITKLYNSEWHVLARTDIKSLEDLRGKTVNLWKPVSATGIGGTTIFDMLNININAVYLDTQLAIEKVKSGEIAATTLLAGAPIKGYAGMENADGLHFVPVDLKSAPQLLTTFLPSKLKHKDYPNLIPQGQVVQTVASSALLAVYNWPKDSFRYNKLKSFVETFFDNIDKFKKPPRHPKWKTINLAARIPGWTRFKPASDYLERSRRSPNTQQSSPLQKQFRQFLRNNGTSERWANLSAQERENMFQRFLQWMDNKR